MKKRLFLIIGWLLMIVHQTYAEYTLTPKDDDYKYMSDAMTIYIEEDGCDITIFSNWFYHYSIGNSTTIYWGACSNKVWLNTNFESSYKTSLEVYTQERCYEFHPYGLQNLKKGDVIHIYHKTYTDDAARFIISKKFSVSRGYHGYDKTKWTQLFWLCSKNLVRFDVTQKSDSKYDLEGIFQKSYSNLNYFVVYFNSWDTKRGNWLGGVANEGTFVCPKDLPIEYGPTRIPEGWHVQYLEDLHSITIQEDSKPNITIFRKSFLDVGEEVFFSVTSKTGYEPIVTIQGTEVIETTHTGNKYSFFMPDEDVTISVSYRLKKYTITTDEFSIADKDEAYNGETVYVSITDRDGYTHNKTTYNNNTLTVTDKMASFTMPAANVTIATTYTPISYNISRGEYISFLDKTSATIDDQVNFTVANRTMSGYKLDRVLANTTKIPISNYAGSFEMKDFLTNVTITAEYSKIGYTITADEYSTADKTEASEGETVNVTFKDRAGYNLTSATYNGTDLTITNNTAQFTMPAANVTIETTHTPIEYNITPGEFVTVDKTKATINDQVSFTVANRTNNGYKLDKVLVNNTEFSGMSFNMADYLKDVTITAQYSKIGYTITTDDYSSTNKTTANVGDVVNVTFTNRDGYNLTSATYNGTELTITNSAAQFTMPAANVTIATTHTPIEYNITAGEFVTVDKTKATINDQVSFTVADRTNDGYQLDKVLVNNTEFTGRSFNMADYLKDVTITAVYSKIGYTITSDVYSTPNKITANVGDEISVTFANRDGYNLTSATYNGTALTITNNVASFTMPATNVSIATTYTPIEYNITAGEYVTANKSKATINDQVSFTVADRTADGYQLNKVLINNTEISGTSFNMADYLTDVTITAVYSKIGYTITADQYSTPNKTTANVGDEITVTFANRDGYNLISATYNGTELTITDNASQFTMPAANVTIATTHTPIEYNITAGEFVTVDKTKATINDQVSFTVADRKDDGYKLDKVLVNNTEFTGRSFNMADYLKDVTITAQYFKIGYTITTDDYSSTDKTTANVGDVVNVTFTNRVGYNLTSATYNGTELTITNGAAQFTMPAANVTIATTHTLIEYKVTAGEFVTVDKTKATINDQVSFTVADRTNNGYQLDKVLVNNTEFTGTSFNMADYLKDVTITAVYSKNSNPVVEYSITNDEFSTTDKASANEGDVVNVTFKNRGGYNLTSATYNGTELTITNNAAKFTMPAANVTIATTHTLIEYNITAGEFITVDKTKATVNDKVSFTVEDRTNDGYKLDKVLVNNTEFTGTSFNMADYLKDVTITAVYSKNSNPVVEYSITNDEFSTTDKASANEGDVITVTFTNRDGYNLTSATYNGTPLNITNNAAQFTMPAANVTIATTHTPIEYNITAGEFVTVDKTKATINDQVSFTIADRKDDGYQLDKVLVNNTEFTGTSFNMADYLKDVTITAVYSKNSNPVVEYNITNDEFSTTDKSSANEGDVINVTFTNRVGYNLTSATYNVTPLNITNGTAQFTMPAANVTIATTHTLIEYKITTGEFVTVDKTKATINDQVSFTVKDRTKDGYKLDKVLVNNTDFSGTSFNMADYLKDVTITAVYSKNSNPVVEYTITNDEFSTTDKASANEGDVITVTFTNRDGYNLTAATYNGTPLNITNNAAQFTMPAANVTIATTYKPIKNDKLLIVDEIIVEADGYCAGDVLRLSFKTTCKKGKYQIMFSERAKTEGFVDLDFADIEDSERQTAKFDIPSSTNYGNYQGFIRVVDVDGNEGAAFPFGFNIDYPNDIIETKYADLICVNNFSHNYVAYQWMKNGKEIAGANKQFYIDYPALNGVYNVIVTDKNGNKFKVCDFRAAELKTKSAPKPSVNVYPNPAQSMQPVTIELVGVDITEKCEIMLYTHSGSLVQKISDVKSLNVVYLKSGIYTGVVVINGKKLTFKLIVND